MKTDNIAAWQVEEGDLITLGSDDTFFVKAVEDGERGITLTLLDDDGDTDTFSFTADDDISLVVSLEDD